MAYKPTCSFLNSCHSRKKIATKHWWNYLGMQVWIGIGKARSKESTRECTNYRNRLHLGRIGASHSLHVHSKSFRCGIGIGCPNLTGAADFWLCQGLLHRKQTPNQCPPNYLNRSHRICSGFWHGQGCSSIKHPYISV